MELVYEFDQTMRLDLFLLEKFPLRSRSFFHKLVSNKCIKVDGVIVNKAGFLLKKGMKINLDEKLFFEIEKEKIIPWEKSNIIKVINETNNYIIIDKPSGISVHPGVGNYTKTLANALVAEFNQLDVSLENRPGIVHRLDKDTSGIMIVSKNEMFTRHIQTQFQTRTIKKSYLAFVDGHSKAASGIIKAPIGKSRKNILEMTIDGLNSKLAETEFDLLMTYSKYSLIEFKPKTGRTHQIRAHAKFIGNPISNDPIYGKIVSNQWSNFGQFLHAYRIDFIDLDGSKKSFVCPPPKEFILFEEELLKREKGN